MYVVFKINEIIEGTRWGSAEIGSSHESIPFKLNRILLDEPFLFGSPLSKNAIKSEHEELATHKLYHR